MNPTNNQTHRKSRRELLTDDIIDQVRTAVREEMSSAPSSLTEDDRTAIEDEILAHTNLVLDALSSAEMQSEGALVSHIANARSDAQRLIRDRRPRPGGAGAVVGAKS